MLRTPALFRPFANSPDRCQVMRSGDEGSHDGSRHPRYVPYSTPTVSVSTALVISVKGTRVESLRTESMSGASGSSFRAWHKARNCGRSSLGVFGLVLRGICLKGGEVVLGLLKGKRRTVLRLSARERIGKARVFPRGDGKRDAEAGGPSALL